MRSLSDCVAYALIIAIAVYVRFARIPIQRKGATREGCAVFVYDLRAGLVRGDDVDHEDQRGATGDGTAAAIAVAKARRNDEEHLRADGLTDKAILPALNNATRRREIGVKGGVAIPRGIELRTIEQPAGVLHHSGAGVGELGTRALDERLGDELGDLALPIHIDGGLAIIRARDLRQLRVNVGHHGAGGLLQILRLGDERHHQQIAVAVGAAIVHTEGDGRVDGGTLDLVVIRGVQRALADLEGALGHIARPGIHELGAVFGIERDAVVADAVTIFDGVAVALLQYDVGAVGHRHRGVERDGRLFAQLAGSGDAGNLVGGAGVARIAGI